MYYAIQRLSNTIYRLQELDSAERSAGATVILNYVKIAGGIAHIFTANVGDSRGIYVEDNTQGVTTTRLNCTHQPQVRREKNRLALLKQKGQQFEVNAKNTRINGLPVSRTLGDYTRDQSRLIISDIPEIGLYEAANPGILFSGTDGIFTSKSCNELNITDHFASSQLEDIGLSLHKYAQQRTLDNRTLMLFRVNPKLKTNNHLVSVLSDGHGVSGWVAKMVANELRRYYLRREFLIVGLLHSAYQQIQHLQKNHRLTEAESSSVMYTYNDVAMKLRNALSRQAYSSLIYWEHHVAHTAENLVFTAMKTSSSNNIKQHLMQLYIEIRIELAVEMTLSDFRSWLGQAFYNSANHSKKQEAEALYQKYRDKLLMIFAKKKNESLTLWEYRINRLQDNIADSELIDDFNFLEDEISIDENLQRLSDRSLFFVVITSDWLRSEDNNLREDLLKLSIIYCLDKGFSGSVMKMLSTFIQDIEHCHHDKVDLIKVAHLCRQFLLTTPEIPENEILTSCLVRVVLQALARFDAHFKVMVPDNESPVWQQGREIFSLLTNSPFDQMLPKIHQLHQQALIKELVKPIASSKIARISALESQFKQIISAKVQQGKTVLALEKLRFQMQSSSYGRKIYNSALLKEIKNNDLKQLYYYLFLIQQTCPHLSSQIPSPQMLDLACKKHSKNAEQLLVSFETALQTKKEDHSRLQTALGGLTETVTLAAQHNINPGTNIKLSYIHGLRQFNSSRRQ